MHPDDGTRWQKESWNHRSNCCWFSGHINACTKFHGNPLNVFLNNSTQSRKSQLHFGDHRNITMHHLVTKCSANSSSKSWGFLIWGGGDVMCVTYYFVTVHSVVFETLIDSPIFVLLKPWKKNHRKNQREAWGQWVLLCCVYKSVFFLLFGRMTQGLS